MSGLSMIVKRPIYFFSRAVSALVKNPIVIAATGDEILQVLRPLSAAEPYFP